MNAVERIPIRHSIAAKLLKRVFGVYVVIAIGVTVVQMVMEYRYQRDSITHGLKEIQCTFEHGLALDLWHLDRESLRGRVHGMLCVPDIVGIRVRNQEGRDVVAAGVVQRHGAAGDVGEHVNPIGLAAGELAGLQVQEYGFGLLPHSFPLVYNHNGQSRRLGVATIYSSTAAIYRRVKFGFLMLAVNALLKTAALWVIFLWFSNRLLHRPLNALATATEEVSLGNLDDFKVELDTPGRNELRVLAESFNAMIANLHAAVLEREEAEAENRQLRLYLSNIVNSMPSMLISVDNDGIVSQWNQGAENATGISTDEAVGKPLVEVLPRLAEDAARIMATITSRRVSAQRNRPRKDDGETRYEDITVYPLITNGVEGAVIRIDDVTRQHLLEEQLHHAQRMEAIGKLAGGVAHDFNNVLGGILGAGDLLKRQPGLSRQGRCYVDMIIHAAERAADLTSKLLAFGRKGQTEVAPLDLHEVLNDGVAILRSAIDKKVSVATEMAAADSIVRGDRTGLQSAVINLGINAAHAMPDGGRIQISTRNLVLAAAACAASKFELAPGPYVEVAVRDTGCGIPEEDRERIFEPFFTTKKMGKGTGLGLAAVYGTVIDHQGAISLSSEVGHGTEFRLCLPCAREGEQHGEVNQGEVSTGSGRILLVDDEETLRKLGTDLLRGLGYEVITAADGLEAVKIFQAKHSDIDLVIMDLVMPNLDGREAFKRIREIDPECKVMLTTGFTNAIDLSDLRALGFLGVISKPYRMAEFSRILAEILPV